MERDLNCSPLVVSRILEIWGADSFEKKTVKQPQSCGKAKATWEVMGWDKEVGDGV